MTDSEEVSTVSSAADGLETITETRSFTCLECESGFDAEVKVLTMLGRAVRVDEPAYCSVDCWKVAQKRQAEWQAQRDSEARSFRLGQIERQVWPRFKSATPEDLPKALSLMDEDVSLYLYGNVGSGKTHLAWAWWRRWAFRQGGDYPVAQFFTAPDLLEAIRRSYDGQQFNLQRDALVVVDDLGVERPTEWVLEQLYRLIDERYRYAAPTVVTSNLSLAELADRVGDRLASRLAEMCELFHVKGDDRRLL